MKKTIWFVGTARTAFVMAIMMLVSYIITTPEQVANFLDGCRVGETQCPIISLTMIRDVGFPPFLLPHFTFAYETCANWTATSTPVCAESELVNVTFPMIVKALGTGLLTIPLISFLQQISMAKLFARNCGYKIEAGQEFLALGTCNLANSFLGGFVLTTNMARLCTYKRTNDIQ